MNSLKQPIVSVLALGDTGTKGKPCYSAILKEHNGDNYLVIEINALVYSTLTKLWDGQALEEESIFFKINEGVAECEKDGFEKSDSIEIYSKSKDDVNCYLVSNMMSKKKICSGNALVLSTMNFWPITANSELMKPATKQDPKIASMILKCKKNAVKVGNEKVRSSIQYAENTVNLVSQLVGIRAGYDGE